MNKSTKKLTKKSMTKSTKISGDITQVCQDAEDAYSGGLQCAEAVVHAIRKNLAPQMPEALVSAASGFSVGVGGGGCLCGAVSGGVLALGYFFGRTFPTTITDPQSQKTIVLAHELQEAFKAKHSVLCCHVLTKGLEIDSTEQRAYCAAFVGSAAAITAEIITEIITEEGGK